MKVLPLLLITVGVGSSQIINPETASSAEERNMTEYYAKPGINDEQRLFKHILKDYDKAVRPVYNASKAVNVYIGLTLTHIFNIDERSQVLALNAWVEQLWHDERIRWEPSEFGNLSKLTLATTYVWTPDIVLYNK